MQVDKFCLLAAGLFLLRGWYLSWRHDLPISLRGCVAFQQTTHTQFRGSCAGLRRHPVSRRAVVGHQTDTDMNLVNVSLSYGQTAATVKLPRAQESLQRYFKRSAIQLLRDVADGQKGGVHGTGVEMGRETMWVEDVDPEASTYIIHYPSAKVMDPSGIGCVDVIGPKLLVIIEDAKADRASESIPPGSHLTWHHARAFGHSYMINGRDICRATIKFPLAPALCFNVSLSCNFTMEMGFAGTEDSDDGYMTIGLKGTAGFPKVRFPGAVTLMSLFLPRYARGAMQDAANGMATTFKALQHQFE